MLSNHFFLRKIISILLICVFAFSITPVIFLHNLVANHKDISYSDSKQTNDQYARAGINCRCIDFVAEAQFLNSFVTLKICTYLQHSAYTVFYTETFYSQHHFYAELRGPPACA